MAKQAFVLRVAPSGVDMVAEALDSAEIIIGWAEAKGLLDPALEWEHFRAILSKTYYWHEDTLRKAGSAAGNMWRFIREMQVGDIVVVPHGREFFVAKVTGPATYSPDKVRTDSAYRRKVEWLNGKTPIPREHARSALLLRMKSQSTSVDATDLIDQIEDCVALADRGEKRTFADDLQRILIQQVLTEIQDGRMDDRGFERLIETVLRRLGAVETRIVPRSQDKGADIIAVFRVAGVFPQTIAVQAKHWKPHPPVGKDVVEQLIRGIEAEETNLGMLVTSGAISKEAAERAEEYFVEKGIRIELVDGEQFAKLVVEHGLVAA